MGNLAKGASSLVGSPALVAAMLAFTIAQICKVFTHYHTTGKVDWGRLVGSGGMPSSHTALVVGLTTAIGLKDALDSSIFALCLVFSLVVSARLVFVFRSGWDLLDRIFSFSLSRVLTIVQSEGLLARAFLKPSSPSLSDSLSLSLIKINNR
jgi:Na+/melibiose symporter-like transporter